MNDTKIQNFFKVAETLNFTKAAELLYMSQSVLSRQISAMEEELGFTLFSRSSKNVTLTPSGKAFYNTMKALSGKYDTLIANCRDMEKGVIGNLELGAISIHSIQNFKEIIRKFEEQYPQIKINLTSAMLETQFQYLVESQLDFFFGALSSSAAETFSDIFDYEVICKNKFGIIIPQNHRHFTTPLENLTLSDFSDDTFIVFDNVVNDIDTVKLRCQEAGFTPNMLIAADVESVFLWMEINRGITIIDETSVYASSKNYRFIPMPEFGCNEASIIWNKSNPNPCCQIFINFLHSLKEIPNSK